LRQRTSGAQLTGLDQRSRTRDGGENHIDLPAEQVGDGRRAPL